MNSSSSSPTAMRVPCSKEASLAMARARSHAADRTSAVRDRRRSRTMVTAVTSKATATAITAAAVVRTRTVSQRRRQPPVPTRFALATVGIQAITGAPDRLECSAPEGTVQLVAKMPDVDLDDVGVALEVVVPDVLEDVSFGEDVSLAPQQELQQGHLARRQVHLDVCPPGLSRPGIEAEVSGLKHRRTLSGSAP